MPIKFRFPNLEIRRALNKKSPIRWIYPLCKSWLQEPPTITSLPELQDEDKCDIIIKIFDTNWNNEIELAKKDRRKPNLLKILYKMFWKKILFLYSIQFVNNILIRVLQCVLLAKLIDKFDSRYKDQVGEKILVGTLLLSCILLFALMKNQPIYETINIGNSMRSVVSSLVYRKATRLNLKSFSKMSVGNIVTIISSDISRIIDLIIYSHMFATGIFQIAIVGLFMVVNIGLPSLTGVLSVGLFTIPLQYFVSKLGMRYCYQVTASSDTRVKLITEILAGIRVIKMYAWEKFYEKLVDMARQSELESLYKYLSTELFYYALQIQKVAAYLSIMSVFLVTKSLSPTVTFSTSLYISVLRTGVIMLLPKAITAVQETKITMDRITEVLQLEEVDNYICHSNTRSQLELQEVQVSWSGNSKFMLQIGNIKIKPGSLCAVVGGVGSGKTSLLNLLLGELSPDSGKVIMNGTVSYCSQEAWLFSTTIKSNILCGQEYDKVRFEKVVEACSLSTDFQRFSDGDETIVGERGVILSGGQKARINLARAVYRDADIYLLDDPLSAVDTKVGKYLFEKCIKTYLGDKTRIIVTHQLQYLDNVDLIIAINEGKAEIFTSIEELKKRHYVDELSHVSLLEVEQIYQESMTPSIKKIENVKSITKKLELKSSNIIGAMNKYIKAGKYSYFMIILFMVILNQILSSASDYWLALWCRREYLKPIQIHPVNNGTSEIMITHDDTILRKATSDVIVLSSMVLAGTIVTIISNVVMTKFFMTASQNLHENMFHKFLRAPMSFLNSHSSGNILSRFSVDLNNIDQKFPDAVKHMIQAFLAILGCVVVTLITNWYMFIVALLFLLTCYKIMVWFTIVGVRIKQVEVSARSPVYSYLNSTLLGLTTIRANNIEYKLTERFHILMDSYSSALRLCYASSYAVSWFSDLISLSFVACTIYGYILVDYYLYRVDQSIVGLGVYQSLLLSNSVLNSIRKCMEALQYMVSIEKIVEYTNIDIENSGGDIKDILPETWPDQGKIEFLNVNLNYSMDIRVLTDISFTIMPKQKIGIVGRTGAGKSSLITCLFNLNAFGGTIKIDGIDTKNIKLEHLRKSLSIIPQDPVLFFGTIRHNLDPFNEYSEEEVWTTLEEIDLKSAIPSLDMMITEGGCNFSTGQKQLICLARAILRKNKIVIMDEATANVDLKTDECIQSTIREKFRDCTIITIAHRLNTIIDSDKVLVMDGGRIIEYDHPHLLLQRKGAFFNLVMETGESISNVLRNLAKVHYDEKCHF